jgi:hypothetical protein
MSVPTTTPTAMGHTTPLLRERGLTGTPAPVRRSNSTSHPPRFLVSGAVIRSNRAHRFSGRYLRTRRRSVGAVTAFAVLSVGLASVLVACSNDPADTASPSQPSMSAAKSAELDGSSLPPWPAPTDVAARAASAGLNLGPMGMAEHYHPHLLIIIHGNEVPVPANIGVDSATGAMSALHTHQDDGTIHIEADKAGEVFTLGQLFIEWGVKLTPTQIGGVHAKDGQKVMVTSNGAPVADDPMNLRLKPDQKIVLQLS